MTPWFLISGGLLLTLRILLPGILWAGIPNADSDRDDFWARAGRAVALGLLWNLLSAVALLSIGAWSSWADWTAWAIFSALGAVRFSIVWKTRAAPAAADAISLRAFCRRTLLPLTLLLTVLTLIPLLFPPRSEWLAGGWDPGIYQNNALVIARDGHLRGRPSSVYSHLPENATHAWLRSEPGYREILPSVPLRGPDGAIPLYFFHLTSICGALFARMGGVALLTRMPSVLALWTLFPLMALLGALGWRGPRRRLALALWMLAPMGWFQQALPTSEPLYILLWLTATLFYLDAARRATPFPLAAAATLFALTVNHLNTALLAAVALVPVAAAEGDARCPGRARRLAFCAAALAAGMLWDTLFSGVTVIRLEGRDHALRILLAACAGVAACAALLAVRPLPIRLRRGGLTALRLAALILGPAFSLLAIASLPEAPREWMFSLSGRLGILGIAWRWLIRLIPFHGTAACVLAGAGLAALAWKHPRNDAERALRLFVVALGGLLILLLLKPGIASLFPWAVRRYIVFWLPLMTLLETCALVTAWRAAGPRRWARVAVLILAAVVMGEGLVLSARAARAGDYVGLHRAINSIEHCLRPDDLLIADAPEWGTPLLLAGGHEVFNGRRLWRSNDPAEQQLQLQALEALRAQTGRRLLWLTSTRRGMDIYPSALPVLPTPLLDETHVFQTLRHDNRNRSYTTDTHTNRFRLYLTAE